MIFFDGASIYKLKEHRIKKNHDNSELEETKEIFAFLANSQRLTILKSL